MFITSAAYNTNSNGPNTEPCGTPLQTEHKICYLLTYVFDLTSLKYLLQNILCLQIAFTLHMARQILYSLTFGNVRCMDTECMAPRRSISPIFYIFCRNFLFMLFIFCCHSKSGKHPCWRLTIDDLVKLLEMWGSTGLKISIIHWPLCCVNLGVHSVALSEDCKSSKRMLWNCIIMMLAPSWIPSYRIIRYTKALLFYCTYHPLGDIASVFRTPCQKGLELPHPKPILL